MADLGACTSLTLAETTGVRERYVREWLANQAAGGYVVYDPEKQTYALPMAQAMVLALDQSPVFMAPAFEVAASFWLDEDKIVETFRSGEGLGWHEHNHRLFCGTESFFRTGYRAHLVSEWLPALDGVVERLRRGARVADIGCGHGVSTILMAKAFPQSSFIGLDYHDASVVTAASTPLSRAWRATPRSRLRENLNPIGRMYYAASAMACTPNSLSQNGELGLGAQAGEERLRKVAGKAGFSDLRRAAQTPVNLILELTA